MADEAKTTEIEPSFESFEEPNLKTLLAKRLPLLIAGVVLVVALIISSILLLSSTTPSNKNHGFILSNTVPGAGAPLHKSSTSSTTSSGTQVFSSRDPFVSPIPVPTTTPPTTTSVTTTTIPPTTTGGTTSSTSPTSSTTTTGTPSGTGTFYPQPDQQISLLNISTGAQGPIADVQVGGVSYTVSQNQQFANSYQVISLSTSNQCGQFSYKGSPFKLCKSQQILK